MKAAELLAFEAGAVDPEGFDHRAHLWAAFHPRASISKSSDTLITW